MEDIFKMDLEDLEKDVAPAPAPVQHDNQSNGYNKFNNGGGNKPKSTYGLEPSEYPQHVIKANELKAPAKTFTVIHNGKDTMNDDVKNVLYKTVKKLTQLGFTFRYSGDQRDKMNEVAFAPAKDNTEVYVSFSGFNKDHLKGLTYAVKNPTAKAYGIISNYMNKLFVSEKVTSSTRAMFARNAHILFGADCESPINLVLVFSADGAETPREINYKTTGYISSSIELLATTSGKTTIINLGKEGALSKLTKFFEAHAPKENS